MQHVIKYKLLRWYYVYCIWIISCVSNTLPSSILCPKVESSRQMYHAVMEEVVRFLERCHQSLNAIDHQSQVPRSKCGNFAYTSSQQSLHQTAGDCSTMSRLPLSTNMVNNLSDTMTSVDTCNDTMTSSIGSYTNFRDFTW